MSASTASRSDKPCRDCSTITDAITSPGIEGRPRPDGNKSANNESGNNRSRCSAKNRNTLPTGSRCPANDSTSNTSRCGLDSPCPTQQFQSTDNQTGRHADGLFSRVLAEPETLPVAKTNDGPVEQIRVLMAVRRSAMKARVAAHRQITCLLITAPEALKARFTDLTGNRLIDTLATTRPGPATTSVSAATGQALRRLARRHQNLTAEIDEIDTELHTLTIQAAPTMLATKGYGVITTATLLISAGDNPDRLRTEASFAALCGAAPIPASSGKTTRHRLNRGGDRQGNWALHQIALVRLSTDTRTKTYAAKLRAAGKSKKDVLRCLKRAIAREAWHLLVHPTPAPRTDDLRTLRHQRGLTLTQVAQHLSTAPTRISELERGTRPDILLSNAYREYLTAA